MTYTDVSLTFQCAVFTANQLGDEDLQFNETKAKLKVITLQDYIRDLDRKLVAWKQSVNNARGKYYELNYFTTIQLLQLRKELGMLTQPNATHIVKPNVLMLLKSISPQVDSRVVVDSMQVLTQPEPMDYEGEVDAITTATAILLLPTLMYEDLTEHQQETYARIVDLGYSESHVLRAFEECGEEATIYNIEQWCDSNEDSTPEEEHSVGPLEREEEMTDIYNPLDDSDSDESMDTTRVLPESQASTGESYALAMITSFCSSIKDFAC